MKAIQILDTTMPQSVVCANCGKRAHFEDYDYDQERVHLLMYLCYGCDWWTDWEITIVDGEIESSELYYQPNDRESCIAWYEARDWPYFWMPDGLKMPERTVNSE